ncbi:helix-turn-helix transcriptional regulator [Salinirubellus sp. GCM10025818]|uniref:helix-turn-helix transcriptional regulator n=1 Tax=Salinirubellus TaxID=2162630 RepID=UPI0030D03916
MTGPSRDVSEGSRDLRGVLGRREQTLDALASGPKDQRDLRDALGVSRSTAYKSLRELEDAGLIRQTDEGRYRLTQYGSLAHRRHSEYVEHVNRLAEAQVVVKALPHDLLVPLSFVERGHLVVATPHAPERPIDRLRTEARRSSEYRVLSPIALPRFLSTIHERVEHDGLVAELLVETGAVEYLREYDRLDEALATPGFDVLGTDESIEVGLFLGDDRELAGLFAYGPQGGVVGMLLSDAPEAYRWADRTYRRFREDATPIDPGS